MGAKDWLLVHADGEIQPVLQSAPALDRQVTRALVRRLYPGHQLSALADGTLVCVQPFVISAYLSAARIRRSDRMVSQAIRHFR